LGLVNDGGMIAEGLMVRLWKYIPSSLLVE
jgi:hypothetical protein